MKNLLKISLVSLLGVVTAISAAPRIANNAAKETISAEELSSVGRPTTSRGTDFNFVTPSEPANNELLYCNSPKEYLMKKNTVYKFQFNTLTKGTYVFEAISDAPTKLCVEAPGMSKVFDAKMSGLANARIQIELNEYTPITVYARMGNLTYNPDAEYVTMSARKRRVSIVTHNTMDEHVVGAELNANCTTLNYERNCSIMKDHFTLDIHANTVAESVISSSFYAGDVVGFWGGCYDNDLGHPSLYWDYGEVDFYAEDLDFTGTPLAIWAAFGSAKDSHYNCVARKAHLNGAKCSIGIIDVPDIDPTFVMYFLCRLLNTLSIPGITVRQAIDLCEKFEEFDPGNYDPSNLIAALNQDDLEPDIELEDHTIAWINKNIDDWNDADPVRIYGDSTIVINDITKSNGSFSLTNTVGPILPRPGIFEQHERFN